MPTLGRLTRRTEFLRTAAARQKWVTPGVIVQARVRDPGEIDRDRAADRVDEDGVRVGLTASRKVGNAVTRNRVRRRLRALARDILPHAGRPGTDYVLIGRQGTVRRSAAELRGDLENAVRRLNAQLDGKPPRNRRPKRAEAQAQLVERAQVVEKTSGGAGGDGGTGAAGAPQ